MSFIVTLTFIVQGGKNGLVGRISTSKQLMY